MVKQCSFDSFSFVNIVVNIIKIIIKCDSVVFFCFFVFHRVFNREAIQLNLLFILYIQ
jgi:hypothetical protein